MDSRLLNYSKSPIPVLPHHSPHSYKIMPVLLSNDCTDSARTVASASAAANSTSFFTCSSLFSAQAKSHQHHSHSSINSTHQLLNSTTQTQTSSTSASGKAAQRSSRPTRTHLSTAFTCIRLYATSCRRVTWREVSYRAPPPPPPPLTITAFSSIS